RLRLHFSGFGRWPPARSGCDRRPRPGRCPRDGLLLDYALVHLLDYALVHLFATKRDEVCAEQGLRTGGPGGAPVRYGAPPLSFLPCPGRGPQRLAGEAAAVRPMEMTRPAPGVPERAEYGVRDGIGGASGVNLDQAKAPVSRRLDGDLL